MAAGKGDGWQNPVDNYIEWSQHRLDPGHYLGGTLPPHLRKSALGPRARRLSGVLLMLMGVLTAFSLVPPLIWDRSAPRVVWLVEMVATAGVCVLIVGAGMSMLRSARKRPRGADASRH